MIQTMRDAVDNAAKALTDLQEVVDALVIDAAADNIDFSENGLLDELEISLNREAIITWLLDHTCTAHRLAMVYEAALSSKHNTSVLDHVVFTNGLMEV